MNEANFLAGFAGSVYVVVVVLVLLCIAGAAFFAMIRLRDLWERHRRPEYIPPSTLRENGRERLIRELTELTQGDADYERCTMTPAQEISDLFNLDPSTVRTMRQVKHWERVHDSAQFRLRRISGVLSAKRDQFVLEGNEPIPDFLRPPGDAALSSCIRSSAPAPATCSACATDGSSPGTGSIAAAASCE